MAVTKYAIELSKEEKEQLEAVVSKGTVTARKIMRANILLASDRKSDNYMTIAEMAKIYHVSPTTIQNVRTSYLKDGLEKTINRKKRTTSPIPAKVTGEVEAHIIALACGDPPKGYAKWTLRLLADQCVELNYLESVSHTTIGRVLKKTNISLI